MNALRDGSRPFLRAFIMSFSQLARSCMASLFFSLFIRMFCFWPIRNALNLGCARVAYSTTSTYFKLLGREDIIGKL